MGAYWVPENEYKVYMCKTTGSMSNIIGGLTYILKDYLLQVLPNNLIKNTWIDGELTSTQANSYDNYKPDKPILGIKPRINLSHDLYDSMLPQWHRSDGFTFRGQYNYTPILGNPKAGVYMYATPTRVKVEFDVSILLNTRMQQIDVGYQLGGLLPFKRPYKINSFFLETPIPRFYMETIRDYLKLRNDTAEDIYQFNDFILKSTENFFRKKVILSTGKEEYVYQFRPIINTNFDNLDMDDGEASDMVHSNFRVSFNVSFECWVPYYLIMDIQDSGDFNPPKDYNYDDINTVSRTLKFSFGEPIPEELDNRKMMFFDGFVLEKGKSIDTVEFGNSLTPDLSNIIDFQLQRGLYVEDILTPVIYHNRQRESLINYTVDWKHRTISQIRFIPDSIYHLAIYADMDKYHKVIYELSQLKKQDEKQQNWTK